MSTRRFPAGRLALASALLVMTCCQTPAPPPPAPAPAPSPVATQAPPPQRTLPPATNWIDRPQTAGDWQYSQDPGETLAIFGTPGNPQLIMRCDRSSRQVGLARVIPNRPTGNVPLRISAETTSREISGRPIDSSRPLVGISLPANDPLFDAIAITRGRFAVEVEGESGLYVPAWAEVSRVIEDCR